LPKECTTRERKAVETPPYRSSVETRVLLSLYSPFPCPFLRVTDGVY
jgi:hypothetical protein